MERARRGGHFHGGLSTVTDDAAREVEADAVRRLLRAIDGVLDIISPPEGLQVVCFLEWDDAWLL